MTIDNYSEACAKCTFWQMIKYYGIYIYISHISIRKFVFARPYHLWKVYDWLSWPSIYWLLRKYLNSASHYHEYVYVETWLFIKVRNDIKQYKETI